MIGYTIAGEGAYCPRCAAEALGMAPADAVGEGIAGEVNRWDCDDLQELADDEERTVWLRCDECRAVLATFEPINEEEG